MQISPSKTLFGREIFLQLHSFARRKSRMLRCFIPILSVITDEIIFSRRFDSYTLHCASLCGFRKIKNPADF